ncbi:hypothetical protein LLH00_10935 [bacterium]|nr:hypothetical protein [bacterium]
MRSSVSRRSFVRQSLAFSGASLAAAGLSLEHTALQAAQAAAPAADSPRVTGLQKGRLGKLEISRLLCGGNLFSGFAHSRDLVYVSGLLKNYFTPEKIMDTLQVAEENGINAAVLRCDEQIGSVLERYRKERGGRIQWIAQTYPKLDNLYENVQYAIDHGAVAAFPQGGVGDTFVTGGHVDELGKVLEFMKKNGLVAGIGSHMLAVTAAAEKHGLNPDFYFKTINTAGYETQPPAEVAAFFREIDKPWIAFKVLGAGAVLPQDGFKMAFSQGADFINVGMFDFQVKEDIVAVRDLLAGNLDRQRPWCS